MSQSRVFLIMKIVALSLMVVVMVVLAYNSKLHEKRYVESARVGVPDIGPISARPSFTDFHFQAIDTTDFAKDTQGTKKANDDKSTKDDKQKSPGENLKPQKLPAKEFFTADMHGKVVHILFWASWCEPCQREFPVLEKIAQKYTDQIQFILISTDLDEESVSTAKSMHASLMPTSLLTFSNISVSPIELNVTSLPHHIILDKHGGIAATFIGGVDDELDKLEKLYQGLF